MWSSNNPPNPPDPPPENPGPSHPRPKRLSHGTAGTGSERRRSQDTGSEEPAPAPPPLQLQQTEPVVQNAVQEKPSAQDLREGTLALDIEEPPEVEIDYVDQWMKSFLWIRIFLIVIGRWPFTYVDEDKKGYRFKFTCKCVGFYLYLLTTLITIYGLIASGYHTVAILMNEKIITIEKRSKTEIIEQALLERHTMILIIILGSYMVNTVTSVFIFVKRDDIAESLTKWTKFLKSSKLSGGTMKTYSYVGLVAANYCLVTILLFFMSFIPSPVRSSTLIGGPTVVAMLFMRHFITEKDYMENFAGSWRHMYMTVVGMVVYFYVVTTCNAYMYLLLWMLKSIETATSAWNARMVAVLELTVEELKVEQNTKDRTTYEALYNDHIGIVRVIAWVNNMFAYSLEIYVLFQVIKIVYQLYLAAIVLDTNGDKVKYTNLGKFFIRPGDQLPALVITYENAVSLVVMLMAASYLDDTAYESYEDLRKKSLLLGTYNERESFFYLSMFQSYTSTTKMAVYGGSFFTVDRYTILHTLSAVMSHFLVVFQFRPLFDLDTVDREEWRMLVGDFLSKFEGLPPNHTHPTAE